MSMESNELATREDAGRTVHVQCECGEAEALPYLPLLALDENGHLRTKTFEEIWNLKNQ